MSSFTHIQTHTHAHTHTHTVRKMVTICYSCAALVLLTVLCVPSVYSYSAGAREESCYNMEAAHVDSISGNNEPSNDCFELEPAIPCQFSVELIALVNSDDRTVIDDGTITTYECGQVYEGKQQ